MFVTSTWAIRCPAAPSQSVIRATRVVGAQAAIEGRALGAGDGDGNGDGLGLAAGDIDGAGLGAGLGEATAGEGDGNGVAVAPQPATTSPIPTSSKRRATGPMRPPFSLPGRRLGLKRTVVVPAEESMAERRASPGVRQGRWDARGYRARKGGPALG